MISYQLKTAAITFALMTIVAAGAYVSLNAQTRVNRAALARSPQDHGNMVKEDKPAMQTKQNDFEAFAFVELFTSEGCSSCPSADENLERIAKASNSCGKNVYTLSYHVDYWNRLGWKDPYSSALFSHRQRDYAKQFDSNRIYTPQFVVNGQVELVGSNRKAADQEVDSALDIHPSASIRVDASTDSGKVSVEWQVEGLRSGDVVNIALVQNRGVQQVSRGENASRRLTHVNIVRQFRTVQQPANSGQLTIETPHGFAKEEFHVVGFVQSSRSVRAIAKSDIRPLAVKSSLSNAVPHQHSAVRPEAFVQQNQNSLVSADRFLRLLTNDCPQFTASLGEIRKNWNVSYVPMMLEAGRFLPGPKRSQVVELMESKTGNKFGSDFDRWLQWNWQQSYEPHPEYAQFKSKLYQKIDPRFAEYFADTDDAQIRLDEIRWGGVRRDGIPPLKTPKMIPPEQATYLADSDVVFGIDLNGDARCYPKRILAWHEMFKDTIGGDSVCGVY